MAARRRCIDFRIDVEPDAFKRYRKYVLEICMLMRQAYIERDTEHDSSSFLKLLFILPREREECSLTAVKLLYVSTKNYVLACY